MKSTVTTLIIFFLCWGGVNAQSPRFLPAQELDFEKMTSILLKVQEDMDELTEAGRARESIELGREAISWYDSLDESFQGDDYPYGIYIEMTLAAMVVEDIDLALDFWEKTIDHGMNNYAWGMHFAELEPLHDHPRFIELMEPLKERSDYIGILRRDHNYIPDTRTELPPFTYGNDDDYADQYIKLYFRTDTLIKGADELSRIIGLMTWVHNNIPHNGSNSPFCTHTAIDLYNYNKANNNIGINCRALAIVLNDIYLSMGFKSRFVTCLPKDEDDSDCHVINCVYSEDLGKWLWMDPSFNAYPMDEEGTILSIAEVRQMLIDDIPVRINSGANWNNKEETTTEHYIYNYMAKNLYWLQVTAESRVMTEPGLVFGTTPYVSLVPSGYKRSDYFETDNNWFTSDPEYFWQLPLE